MWLGAFEAVCVLVLDMVNLLFEFSGCANRGLMEQNKKAPKPGRNVNPATRKIGGDLQGEPIY